MLCFYITVELCRPHNTHSGLYIVFLYIPKKVMYAYFSFCFKCEKQNQDLESAESVNSVQMSRKKCVCLLNQQWWTVCMVSWCESLSPPPHLNLSHRKYYSFAWKFPCLDNIGQRGRKKNKEKIFSDLPLVGRMCV